MIGDRWHFVRDGVGGTCVVTEEKNLPCGCIVQKYERHYSNHPVSFGHRFDPVSEPAKGHRAVCRKR